MKWNSTIFMKCDCGKHNPSKLHFNSNSCNVCLKPFSLFSRLPFHSTSNVINGKMLTTKSNSISVLMRMFNGILVSFRNWNWTNLLFRFELMVLQIPIWPKQRAEMRLGHIQCDRGDLIDTESLDLRGNKQNGFRERR